MTRKNILNNMMLDNNRKQQTYQALLTDLTLLGYVKLEDAEKLLGYTIPEYLSTPDGKTVKDLKVTAEKKTEVKKPVTSAIK